MPLFADRYDLGPIIGYGGMAEVQGAHDTRLDRPVAVKIMRPEVAHQALVRERFESEARLAARLMHPNVVSVFDSGEYDRVPYIVMERLPGETLRDRLANGPMSEPEARQLAAEVLAALETAHAAGVLHRDIKPANVLAAGNGHWKVADFGIAKALEVTTTGDATATGVVLGTPAYLAPERLFGAPATVASDLYSVGVVLYEALAGVRPYDTGSGGGLPGVAAGAPLAPLASLRPGVDPSLASAIERSLAREPSERFWSAGEMAASVGGAGGARPTGVMAPEAAQTQVMAAGPATEVFPMAGAGAGRTSVYTPADAGPAGGRPGGPFGAPPGGQRRNPAARALAVLAGVAVLAAIIIALVAESHGSHGGSPATTSRTTTAPATTLATTAPTPAPTLATTLPPSTTTSSTSTTSTTATPPTTLLPVTVPGPAGAGPPGPGGPGGKKH